VLAVLKLFLLGRGWPAPGSPSERSPPFVPRCDPSQATGPDHDSPVLVPMQRNGGLRSSTPPARICEHKRPPAVARGRPPIAPQKGLGRLGVGARAGLRCQCVRTPARPQFLAAARGWAHAGTCLTNRGGQVPFPARDSGSTRPCGDSRAPVRRSRIATHLRVENRGTR
jgi:hypothetical protein